MTPFRRFRYHKVEALDFAGGADGILFATDDENFGSSITFSDLPGLQLTEYTTNLDELVKSKKHVIASEAKPRRSGVTNCNYEIASSLHSSQ